MRCSIGSRPHSYCAIEPPCAATTPIDFAVSIEEPPPSATSPSQPDSRYSSAARSTSAMSGLGRTLVEDDGSIEMLATPDPRDPLPATPGSVTSSGREMPSSRSDSGQARERAGPVHQASRDLTARMMSTSTGIVFSFVVSEPRERGVEANRCGRSRAAVTARPAERIRDLSIVGDTGGAHMLIVDAHLDLAWNACQWGRDLLSARGRDPGGRARLPGRAGGAAPWRCRSSARRTSPSRSRPSSRAPPVLRSDGLDYATVAEAAGAARRPARVVPRARARRPPGRARRGRRAASTRRRLAVPGSRAPTGPAALGVVLSIEGADPIAAPADLSEWHAAGLAHRRDCPTTARGRYAGGHRHRTRGLTDSRPGAART